MKTIRLSPGGERRFGAEMWVAKVREAMAALGMRDSGGRAQNLAKALYTNESIATANGRRIDNPHVGGINADQLNDTLKAMK